MCEMEAPDLFEAERDSVKLLDPQPDDSHLEEVKRAVRYCPTQALRIIEE
jgi:ferredoxin